MHNKTLASLTFLFITVLSACTSNTNQNIADQVAGTTSALTSKDPSSNDGSSTQILAQMSAPGIERSIVPVTEDIYRFFDNNHSTLFLVTNEGVLFIDPLNVSAAEWVNDQINKLFDKEVTHVLYSHAHQDHASGAAEFGDVEIISHANSFSVINPPADQALIHGYDAHDKNGDGVIQKAEAEGDLVERFVQIDRDNDGVLTGQETESYINRNVIPPTQTYNTPVHTVSLGGKTVEMHYVGGNHAADMSYIFFPQESLIFYVDVISLGDLPFGPLAWYSKVDSENTYAVALAIDADIAVPSHGKIGTQDDVKELQNYMNDLRERVIDKIDQGISLEEIQMTLDMQDYAHFNYFEQRLPLNIQGMHREILEERASN